MADPPQSVGPPSIWLYASAEEIAAALESHRAAVVRTLRAQRFSKQTSDEAFDLAIVNLFRSRPAVSSTGSQLGRWLRRAAFHRAKELRDREVPRHLCPDPPDRTVPPEAEEIVYWRLTLNAVLRRIASLRPEDRDAVLTVVRDELDDMGHEGASQLASFLAKRPQASRDTTYMRVHRARKNLRRFRGRLAALPLVRWCRRGRRLILGAKPVGVAGLSVAAVIAVTAVPPARSDADRPASPAPTVEGAALSPIYLTSALTRVSAAPSDDGSGFAKAAGAEAPQMSDPASALPTSPLRTPPLPVSQTGVEKHPRAPGDQTLACIRDPELSVCLRHPLAEPGRNDEVITLEN